MSKNIRVKGIDRIVDANFNRLKEGLRVCEEIARFVLCSRGLTADFKRVRHRADGFFDDLGHKLRLLRQRNSATDPGRQVNSVEIKRKDHQDIFFANIQRAKESARVLEEFSKLSSARTALGFKGIRYAIYQLEKKTAGKLAHITRQNDSIGRSKK